MDATVQELKEVLKAKGLTLFTAIDHSAEAERVGLRMPNTNLVVFGNAKAGTPIMLATPTAALDLPLKILIWEDAAGVVWLSYNSTCHLQERHGFQRNWPAALSG